MLGNTVASRYVDRLGADRAVGFALVLMALSLLAWPWARSVSGRASSSVPWALAFFSTQSLQQARLGAAAPALAPALMALNTSAIYLGQAAAPRAAAGSSPTTATARSAGSAWPGLSPRSRSASGPARARCGALADERRRRGRPTYVEPARPASAADLFFTFNRLALQGFGGVLAVAQRELVERKGWLTRQEFVEMLALSQVLPGPNVVNLGLMFGDRFFGLRGAIAAVGGMLVVPLVIVMALTLAYAEFSRLAVVAGALRGMGAVAAGLVMSTAFKLIATLGTNRLGRPLAVAFAIAHLRDHRLAALAAGLGHRRLRHARGGDRLPALAMSFVHPALSAADLLGLFAHFLVLSLLAVGGAITTAPDMHRYVVAEHGWITDAQFSASVAIAQAAPGPNVLFVAVSAGTSPARSARWRR